MSQTGISWGFGEVVSTKNAFNQKTDREEKKKRNSEGKAVGEDIADPKYRGEIEVTMQANQGQYRAENRHDTAKICLMGISPAICNTCLSHNGDSKF